MWASKNDPSQRTGPSVLIAVESILFADALSRSLTARGLNCLVAEDGKYAFTMFLERRPDIAVLSFGITKKEDGFDAAKAILKSSSKAEIVILTDSNSEISKTTEQSGVEIFIDKHTSLSKIEEAICALANLKRSTCNVVSR